jgi:hypothetical protein
MGRPRKKQFRHSSVIDSELDRRFSVSGSGSDSDAASHESDIVVEESQPIVLPQKRAKPASGRHASPPHIPIPTPTVSQTINYATSVFSSAEMKKAVTKRVPKCSSFRLQTEEPWDTLKAQLLVKVSDALGDAVHLDFSKYNFMVSILRVISKPGIPLTTDNDYDLLLTRIKSGKVKEPILANVTITQLDDDKENEPATNDKPKKNGRKDPDTLPGNVEKINNIQRLQQHWKCNKKQNNCIGVYCYIDREGNHLSLSHQRLDCWASAMVLFFLTFYLFFIFLTRFPDIDERRRLRFN